jgi:hypothetical protein
MPAAVQQLVCGMQLFVDGQAFPPTAHWHDPPAVGQEAPPVPAQSASVQQAELGMHELIIAQIVSPPGHWQAPPGFGQISPVTGQSASEQHVPVGMHMSAAMHAV